MAGIGRIIAVHLAGNHDADRRLELLHGANLYRRSMGAQQQPVALCLCALLGDEQRVLRIARRMIRREVKRFEVVVVGFDDRPFLDRISEVAEYGDNFVQRLDDRMLGADGTVNSRKGDVDGYTVGSSRLRATLGRLNALFDSRFDLVYALAYFAFRIFGRKFQPEIVDLRENAILARHPAIAEAF